MDNTIALLGFLAFCTHATVSFRSRTWLPKFLGQGLSQEHPAVHIRVSLCNLYYASLMAWLIFIRIGDPTPPSLLLKIMFCIGIGFTFSQFYIRGKQFFKTI